MRNPSSDLRAFVGRVAERSQLTDLIAAAATGRSQVALIVGEGGSGKTMLVDEIERSLLDGFEVLRADADEYSTTAALAVMSQLGVGWSETPFSAGLELLDRLNSLQASGPVAVLVEDLHWADTASRQALLTTARRLREDRVVMIATTRPLEPLNDDWGRFSLDRERCHRVLLDGFGDGDIIDLARVSGIELTRTQADRLRRHTDGLPLHLHTLLLELPEVELRSTAPELVVPRSLAAATVATVSTLPTEARAMAGALSASPQAAPSALVARVAGVEHPADALDAMLATSLFQWSPHDDGTPIGFTHPLLRMAIYDDLTLAHRRRLHRGWAELVQGGAALAHRVAAAETNDDELADELSATAAYEIERGEHGMAATHLLWAAELTSRRDLAEDRRLRAAHRLYVDDQFGRAAELLPTLETYDDTPLRGMVVGTFHYVLGDAQKAEQWLSSSVTGDPALDPDGSARADAFGQLGMLFTLLGRGADAERAAISGAALEPVDKGVEHNHWWAMSFGAAMQHGPAAGLARLEQRLPASASAVQGRDATLLILRGTLHFLAGRIVAGTDDIRTAIGWAQRGFASWQLPRAHLTLSQLLFASGEWDEAIVHARTTLSLTEDGRFWLREQAQAVVAQVLASRGDWPASDASLAALSAADAELRTIESSVTYSLAAMAVAAARDDPSQLLAAVDSLGPGARTSAITELTRLVWLPTRIGALIDLGEFGAAEAELERLESETSPTGVPSRVRPLALRARLDAARGAVEDAAAGFTEALAAWGPDDPPLEKAVSHRAFARLLRDRGDRRRAMSELNAAYQILSRLGARPYLERVEADLLTCGVSTTSSERSPFELSDKEHDVVALVRKGLTNREIAAEIYVSAKTVEYHLGNVYAKLGIQSRRQLREMAL